MGANEDFLEYNFLRIRCSTDPVLFLDRDDTVIVDFGMKTNFKKPQFRPGAIKFLKKIKKVSPSINFILVTNQSKVDRNRSQRLILYPYHLLLCLILFFKGIKINTILICPHNSSANCKCRKPKSAMFDSKLRNLGLNPSLCYMIGDKFTDLSAGVGAGIKSLGIGIRNIPDQEIINSPLYLGSFKNFDDIFLRILGDLDSNKVK